MTAYPVFCNAKSTAELAASRNSVSDRGHLGRSLNAHRWCITPRPNPIATARR
jgi:hypothetical protein